MGSCRNRRCTSPAGTWDYHNLIGATVEIKSLPLAAYWGYQEVVTSGEYKISDIKFRVSVDGKVFTVVELEGLEGRTFLWKDLEIKCLGNYTNMSEANSIIGRSGATAGGVICGTEPKEEDNTNTNSDEV